MPQMFWDRLSKSREPSLVGISLVQLQTWLFGRHNVHEDKSGNILKGAGGTVSLASASPFMQADLSLSF